jgi:Uma2 family endonuclease
VNRYDLAMSATVITTPLSDEELQKLETESGVEYVGGQLLAKPVSTESSKAVMRVAHAIMSSAIGHTLDVFDSSLGYKVYSDEPEKFRKPDASVVLKSRLAGKPSTGFCTIPADLAIEVISPNDDPYEIETKTREYLDHGFGIVWIVYPHTKTVYAHTLKDVRRFGVNDEIDGGEALPGLRCKVADFFA